MKKFFVLTFLPFFLAFPGQSQASSATSVVETQVEGEAEVYQRVETTVNGETVIKESSQPGRLEVKMEKTGEGEPTVTFSQEEQSSFTPTFAPEQFWQDLTNPIVEFVKNLLSNLTSWFK